MPAGSATPLPNAHPTTAHPRPALGEFFRYHGWLAPGVRLFRQLSFPAKAACIAAAFMVPLLVLMALLLRLEAVGIQSTGAERDGVATVRPALELLRAAQHRRAAAVLGNGDLAEPQQRVTQAFDALDRQRAALAGRLDLGDSFDDLRQIHQTLLSAPRKADPDATFLAHEAFADAVLALVQQVANASGLALDPELQTYHLMNYAVLRAPVQFEHSDRARTLGLLSLQLKTHGEVRRDRVQKALALWRFIDGEADASYYIGIGGDTGLEQRFDMKGLDDEVDRYRQAIERQLAGAEPTGDPQAFGDLASSAVQRQVRFNEAILGLLDERLKQRIDGLQAAMGWQLAMVLCATTLAAYMLLAFYKVMLGGLREVDAHLAEIADGNLTTAPRPWGRDEAAQLMHTMGRMQGSLRRIVGNVLEGSAQVQAASREIADASNDLSGRTEQTAASLQQTASTMEQISTTVRDTAARMAETQTTVERNVAAASHGGQVIRQVVDTMQGIEKASQRIAEITGVIDAIAFQTNLLALNAAVEAARGAASRWWRGRCARWRADRRGPHARSSSSSVRAPNRWPQAAAWPARPATPSARWWSMRAASAAW